MNQQNEIVEIAKRDNNPKRDFLIVNIHQGKHFPAAPNKIFAQFQALAQKVRASSVGKRVLVIGFAETATAIGAVLSVCLDCAYLQTTRETIPNVSYLHFTEAHSHATSQKLARGDLERILSEVDLIVFAEDELTTGNTILDLVRVLQEEFPHCPEFLAACLICGMDTVAQQAFQKKGGSLCFLLAIHHRTYLPQLEAFQNNGVYFPPSLTPCVPEESTLCLPGRLDARSLVSGGAYQAACEALCQQVEKVYPISPGTRLLVLGTEEFMYPALCVAAQYERLGVDVTYHATTRSPISVSRAEGYPFQIRHELRSLYDSSRVTYLYNLRSYDAVFVLTDAPAIEKDGWQTLLSALRQAGTHTIRLIRWCDF